VAVLITAASACAFAGDRGRPSFDKFDDDGAGKLSREEFTKLGEQRGMPDDVFDRLDTNGDGYLSKTELKAGRRLRREDG
jgi:Ca2+-binding EF-hand superfamily protein